MVSWMTINVRVIAGKARAAMAGLQGQMRGMQAQAKAASAMPLIGARQIPAMVKFGNQMQWTGRQIQYNFTLPLLLAAGAATKWELENEKAATHVAKVYGDVGAAAKQFRKENHQLSQNMAEDKARKIFADELRALDDAFVAISNHFGVAQSEVLKVAGAWAAAGVSGRALAESVNLTMQAIIIGDMDAAQATKALISIQAQYNLSSQQLSQTLAQLNAVENATGIDMQGLIDGFQRAAGVAREAGVSTRQLAAMLAALVPSTGSAAQAGNALKTIISRLLAPTKQATEILHEMNIEVDSAKWQNLTFTERLHTVQKQFEALPGPAKAYASSVLASRYQINKFSVLMDEIGPKFSFYEKALEATSSRTKAFNTMQKELNAVLSSNPQRLKQIWTILQNAMTDVVQPLIPYMLYLADSVRKLFVGFTKLPAPLQHVIGWLLLWLGIFGPLLRYMGSSITLIFTMFGGLKKLAFILGIVRTEASLASGSFLLMKGGLLGLIASIVLAPFKLLARAIVLVGVAALWTAKKALVAMAVAVWSTAMSVARAALFMAGVWRAGLISTILLVSRQFFTIMGLGFVALTNIARAAMARVLAFVALGARGMAMAALAGMRAMLVAIAGGVMTLGGLIASGIAAIVSAIGLPIIAAVAAVVAVFLVFRTQITQIWNNIINYFQHSTGGLSQTFNQVINSILGAFYSLPQGVQDAMLAVVRIVRDAALAVYNWFSYINPFATHSPSLVQSVDQGMNAIVKSFGKLNKVIIPFQAAYNMARKFGKETSNLLLASRKLDQAEQRASIRKFAPGSLGTFNKMAKEINRLTPVLNKSKAAMDAQQRVVDVWSNRVGKANAALDKQQKKLDALQKIADIARSKVEALNGAQELLRGTAGALRQAGAGSDILKTYDDQIKALEKQKVQFADAQKAADKQQQVVDKATATRDKYQAQLDKEQASLDKLSQAYNNVNDAISAMQDAMDAAASAASNLQQKQDALEAARKKKKELDKKKKTKGKKDSTFDGKKPKTPSSNVLGFRASKKGDFPDVGGKGVPIRRDFTSQVPQIKDFTKNLSEDTAKAFGDLNPFKPMKKKFQEFLAWAKAKFADFKTWLQGLGSAAFAGVDFSGPVGKIKSTLSGIAGFLTGVLHDIGQFVGAVWRLLGPDIIDIFHNLVKGFGEMWAQIKPQLEKFKPLIKPLGEALANVWKVVKPILAFLALRFLFLAKIVSSVVKETIEPILQALGGIIAGILQTIRGVIELFIGIFTGDFKMIGQAIVDMFMGPLNTALALLKGFGKVLWGIIKGVVEGVVHFFQWLWDELTGHSIIPDMIHSIISWFKILGKVAVWIWDNVIRPIIHFFQVLLVRVVDGLKTWWSVIKAAWHILTTVGNWVWDHVLKPIFDFFVKVKDIIMTSLKGWWELIKTAWKGLTTAGAWIKEHMMDPIFDKIKAGFNNIKDWLTGAKDILFKPIKSIVNGVIGGVNLLIKGINKVSDVLPGIDFHINPIPELAQGGKVPNRRANRGMVTHGARAIVGEGKANHPEFVIPTDPTYRRRATMLLAQAASKIGVANGVHNKDIRGDSAQDMGRFAKNSQGPTPGYFMGGILGKLDPKKLLKTAKTWAVGNLRKIATALYNPIAGAGKDLINNHSSWIPQKIGIFAINKLGEWISGVDNDAFKLATDVKKAQGGLGGGPRVQKAQRFARSQVGKPYSWGGVGPSGYDCSGFMSALTNVLRGKNPYSRVGATASFPWPGFVGGYGGKGGFTIGSTRNYGGSGIGHMAGTLGGLNVESSGGIGVHVGASARGWSNGGFNTHAHLPISAGAGAAGAASAGLKYGGVVQRRPGGVWKRLAEGGKDEAVLPLPSNWQSEGLGGKKEFHFHGDLSFPNITRPDDAKKFIENLEILSRD